jgi:hypothetical protein
MPVVGLGLAIFLHSLWNGSAIIFGGLGFFVAYFIIMVPIFLIMLLVIGLALRREGQLVRQFLQEDLNRGLFTAQEYQQLCSIVGRMGASFKALSQGGVGRWRTCMQFNQMASELAFHRNRVARGVFQRSQDTELREAAYLRQLQDLMQQLRTR